MAEALADDRVHDAALPAELTTALQALRDAGAAERDPVRFHYAAALARRLRSAPDAVRRHLQARLHMAIADCAAHLGAFEPAMDAAPGDAPALAPGPGTLAQLALGIESARDDGEAADEDPRALRSARRFREAWSRMHADDTVEHALACGPEEAGPLNSHALVLRTLTLLRELSPGYLRRFLVQADAMLWLEQGRGRLGLPALRPRAGRPGAASRDRFVPPP